MCTPNYVLTEEYTFGPILDQKTIDAGTFVRPIDFYYVPKHCLEHPAARYFNKNVDVFCYTSIGIIPIPWKFIRKAG